MNNVSNKSSLLSLILWRVLPAIVIVQLAIGWFASAVMEQVVSNELESRLNREAEQYPQILAVKLDALVQTAVSMAKNDLIINGIVDAQERDRYIPVFFESIQVPGPPGAEVTLADYKGRRLASNHIKANYTEAGWLKQVLSGETWLHLSEAGFTVAVPVMISAVAEGMIVIRYGSAQLDSLLQIPTEAAAIAVVTEVQDILYSSNQQFTDHLTKDQVGTLSDWQVVAAAVPGFDNLQLLTAELRSTAFAAVDRLGYFLWATMAISIGAAALAIIAAALMSTKAVVRFTNNIEQITQASDLHKKIKPEGTAEFHRLANTFNRMLGSLKATTASRDDLMKANEDLTSVNDALDTAIAGLAESELRYDLAVKGSSVGIWDFNVATKKLFWSDRYKEILGITDDLVWRDFTVFQDRLHPDDKEQVVERFQRHLRSGDSYNIEYRLRQECGDYVWVHARGQAIWDEVDKPTRMAGSIDDITDRKLAEIKLTQYAEELERSNRELDDFAYIASHDLKEPLRAIYNHASFLIEDYQGKLEEDGEKRLQRMIKLSKRMEQLIADLLYFSRLGRGNQTMETLDLNKVIADIEASLAETLKSRNVQIDVSEHLPSISGHPAHITTLFQNLLTNATKYNDAEEKGIEIGLAPSGRDETPQTHETLYVRDNGIGIAERFQEEIFRIFKRLNSEKAYGEGTGAGLTFVKKIVENHGGQIWLESEIGKGTTFFFTLKKAS